MKNIHILPTDKPSKVAITDTNVLGMYKVEQIAKYGVNQNIYITSDEEIKDCWFINLTNNEIGYIKNNIGIQKNAKKIILTTDQDLIKDGVQSIDDEFLDWFVKNPSCEEIEVLYDYFQVDQNNPVLRGSTSLVKQHKIIIPQEEAKQETLKEVAEIFVNNRLTKQICGDEFYPDIYASKEAIVESHILFTKWQQERSYSEEEAGELVYNIIGEYGKNYGIMIDGAKLNELFEQFKKK